MEDEKAPVVGEIYVVNLKEENIQRAQADIARVIKHARNGVTEFSLNGCAGSYSLRPGPDRNATRRLAAHAAASQFLLS